MLPVFNEIDWRTVEVIILLHQIKQEVEKKRMELLDVSNQYGIHHSKTIQCSQELDKILTFYFKRNVFIDRK